MKNRHVRFAITQSVLAVTFSCVLRSPCFAVDISQTAPNGADGANATTDGGNGSNGQSGFTANSAHTPDPYTTVTAIGGNGGIGGNGAAPSSGTKAGFGGDGGRGGPALAGNGMAYTTTPVTITAIATGGNGGAPGAPGPAGTSSDAGDPGRAGVGGGANASASLFAGTTPSPANATATAIAVGGNGGTNTSSVAGNGGSATSSVSSTYPGPGQVINANSTLTATAIGGTGGSAPSTASNYIVTGGNGGDACASLNQFFSLAPNKPLFTITLNSQGGTGGTGQGLGTHSGNGGTARISFPDLAFLSGDVDLTINQTGGNAGQAINGATLGNGADSRLTPFNFVGSFLGNLTYSQNAVAGNGNNGGGNAISYFETSPVNSPNINVAVSAISNSSSQANVSITGINVVNTSAFASGNLIMVPVSALSISTHGPATAQATAVPVPGSISNPFASATANATTSNPLFTLASTVATGFALQGNQTVNALAAAGPISLANGTPQAAASVIFTPIAPNTGTPINNPLANLQFLASNSSAAGGQNHVAAFSGTMDPTQLAPEELTLALNTLSLPSNFNQVEFAFSVHGLTTFSIDQIFTNYTDASAFLNQTLDLGPLSSYGTAPLAITASLRFGSDTPGQNFELAANLANTDPSPIPEPTSLSLLAASLPLLLKRRR